MLFTIRPRTPRARVAALAVAAGAFVAGCTGPSNAPTAYDDQTRANFLAGCTGGHRGADTTLASQSTCECAYLWFVENVSITDFNAIANGLRSGPDGVPGEQKAVWDRAQSELPNICPGWAGGTVTGGGPVAPAATVGS